MEELQQVEDARTSLESAVEVCQDILKPTAEFTNDEEYDRARNVVLQCVVEGVEGAMKKWDVRVRETTSMFRNIEELKPANWVSDFHSMPSLLPESLFIYGNLKEGARGECYMEWRKYRKIVQEMAEKRKKATKAGEHEAVSEIDCVVDANGFWDVYSHRLPNLSKVFKNVFALCPSGAEVERSFKKLRMILPKDHQRDTIQEEMLRTEMFFSFNRKHLSLFQ
tara:strand:+ start:1663 stop:2331 length:669 start_codon:yes stop_codon:yes gene_type:complete